MHVESSLYRKEIPDAASYSLVVPLIQGFSQLSCRAVAFLPYRLPHDVEPEELTVFPVCAPRLDKVDLRSLPVEICMVKLVSVDERHIYVNCFLIRDIQLGVGVVMRYLLPYVRDVHPAVAVSDAVDVFLHGSYREHPAFEFNISRLAEHLLRILMIVPCPDHVPGVALLFRN